MALLAASLWTVGGALLLASITTRESFLNRDEINRVGRLYKKRLTVNLLCLLIVS